MMMALNRQNARKATCRYSAEARANMMNSGDAGNGDIAENALEYGLVCVDWVSHFLADLWTEETALKFDIARQTKATVSEWFATNGQGRFRESCHRSLESFLSFFGDSILANWDPCG